MTGQFGGHVRVDCDWKFWGEALWMDIDSALRIDGCMTWTLWWSIWNSIAIEKWELGGDGVADRYMVSRMRTERCMTWKFWRSMWRPIARGRDLVDRFDVSAFESRNPWPGKSGDHMNVDRDWKEGTRWRLHYGYNLMSQLRTERCITWTIWWPFDRRLTKVRTGRG